MRKSKIYGKILCLALALILLGSLSANNIQTAGGSVKVRSINFVTEDGINLHALLFIPDSATDKSPAPAVVASHGYNNTAEVQGINSVELSRRGYVVMAIDTYWHGLSGGTSVNVDNKNLVPDMGGYAALQYLGRLPFVDKGRIGLVGHSMGCAVIQYAAQRAFENGKTNPEVTLPRALLLTSNSFITDKEGKKLAYADYPVNIGDIFGKYDEWTEGMWGVKRGSEINETSKAIAAMGFSGAEYGKYYSSGVAVPLGREETLEAARNKTLRVLYSPAIDHPQVHFSSSAVKSVVEFFDITLKDGTETIPQNDLVWFWKEFSTLIAMAGFFLFVIPFAFLLLEVPYFRAIIRPEPLAPTIVSDSKSKKRYWLLYVLCLLPAPVLFYWAVGYPINIVSMGRAVPILLNADNYFQLPAINGIVVLNVLVGLFLLVVFAMTYLLFMKPAGVRYENLGVSLSPSHVGRAALLAAVTFLAGYALLALVDYFFTSDFRFFVFSLKTLSPVKWLIYLKYLPFFLFFFLVSSLTLNSFTRIRGEKEWVNMLLMIGASIGGYVALFLLDYSGYWIRGYKLLMYVPGFDGNLTTALAGLFVWNMIFILPIAAVFARLCFRKTGSIWLGGFINAAVITLFSISNTVIAAGRLF